MTEFESLKTMTTECDKQVYKKKNPYEPWNHCIEEKQK